MEKNKNMLLVGIPSLSSSCDVIHRLNRPKLRGNLAVHS